jgi:formate-dependent nitrite reductase membrane component NrfD
VWADSSWLGLLFLLSGISTSIAALVLVSRWRGIRVQSTEERLERFDRIVRILELVVLVVFVASLGRVAVAFLNAWGVLLLLGVVGVGILMPLRIGREAAHVATAAVLVLFGGFVLRVVVLLGSEQIHVVGAQVIR